MTTTPGRPDLETRSRQEEGGIEEKCFSLRRCIKEHAPAALTGYGVFAVAVLCPPVGLLCLGYSIKCGVQKLYRMAREQACA